MVSHKTEIHFPNLFLDSNNAFNPLNVRLSISKSGVAPEDPWSVSEIQIHIKSDLPFAGISRSTPYSPR